MQNTYSAGNKKLEVWLIVGFLVLLAAGLIVAEVFWNKAGVDKSFNATTAPEITAADWTTGKKDAKVSVIEYGDFECPACAQYNPLIKQLMSEYGSKALFVFRNFPLYQIHANAEIAAKVAEAAGLEGKYWEMNDLLYAKQNDWVSASRDEIVSNYFDKYAASLGLNLNKFHDDMNSSKVKDKIDTDVAGANAASVDHTPTFFINLKQIPNPNDYNTFKSILDQALK